MQVCFAKVQKPKCLLISLARIFPKLNKEEINVYKIYNQAKTSYRKGMAVFKYAKGGLMYEAAIGGQKFSFKAK